MILVLYPSASFAGIDPKIRVLAEKYIERFQQQSVLRSDTSASVLFYSGPASEVLPFQTDRNTLQLK